MKKNDGSICCCKNYQRAKSQSRPEPPIATINVAAVQACGELLWRRETICMIAQITEYWSGDVICVLPYRRNLSLNGMNPSLWQWVCGACSPGWCSFIHMQGWRQHSPIHPWCCISSFLQLSIPVITSCRGHLCSCGQSRYTACLYLN